MIWTLAWLSWFGMFAVIEGLALINDQDNDTLSEHFRLWFRTDTKRGRSLWLVASGGFMMWFMVHILMEGLA